MPYYETAFIARQELSQGQVDEVTDSLKKIIADAGGKIHKTENWGLRSLAFRINKNRKGYYVLIESDVPAAGIQEVQRVLGNNEDILRHMSIKLDELSEGPSPQAGKTDDKEAA